MAYGFNPATMFLPQEPVLPQFLTPEEMQQQAITERFNANRGGGFVPAMMGALDYMRTAMPAQAPTPRTVSGGSVIGLMPEQTNALLNRVNEANMLDQRMFEARQGEMRADSRAREGRILSAREAQARRQQELAIENQKMEMAAKKEAAERARPKASLVPGNPEYTQFQTIGADGQPRIEIRKTEGVALPVDPLKPVLVNTVVDGKNVQMFVTPEVGQTYEEQAPTPDAMAQLNLRRGLMNDFMGLEVLNTETGKYEPVDREFANLLTENFITNNGRVDIGDDANMKVRKRQDSQSRLREVVGKDGSRSLQIEEEGMQLAPPKPDEPSEQKKRDKAVAAIQKQFPKEPFNNITRSTALTYLRTVLDPAEFPDEWLDKLGDGLGFDEDESKWPAYAGQKFNLSGRSATPASPSKPTFKGKDGKDYIDNGDGTATLVE